MDYRAWALARGMTFRWSDDWEVGDHAREYDCYKDGGPDTCEQLDLLDEDGEIVDALGCIDDADFDYRRQLESEMAETYHWTLLHSERGVTV